MLFYSTCGARVHAKRGSSYIETFSAVVKWATVRLVAALAAIFDWEIHVVDVKTALPEGTLGGGGVPSSTT